VEQANVAFHDRGSQQPLSCKDFISVMSVWRVTRLAFFLLCCLPAAQAQELRRATIWDLKLGQPIAAQPSSEQFRGFACGSNGGPPRRPLGGWSDYKLCPAEPSGLHEVYFEYDDEYEYIARAGDLPREVARWAGTTEARFPVIVSALFAEDGTLKMLRMVSDPRPDHRDDTNDADLKTREQSYLLGAILASRFGVEAARDCVQSPPANGESSVGDVFIKQSCERVDAAEGRKIVLRVNFFRRPGQSAVNPQMPSQLTSGQFESSTRVEIFSFDQP
jgi:hypothetical protein